MIYDSIIIGGGIVGFSTAYNLKKKFPKKRILLLEKENSCAFHQTGNNSGVIHSGIYYKPGSQKAINCINGRKKLIKFCDDNSVKYDLCGKIIVATNQSEIDKLNSIFSLGIKNELDGLKIIDREQILEIEPYCSGLKGIYVPQAGIIDYKDLTNKLQELFLILNGKVLYNSKVISINKKNSLFDVITENNSFQSKELINCAGLYSDKINEFLIKKNSIKIIPFRGEYYKIKKEKEYLVNNLIYPVPDPNFPFLGVHFTRMINGGIEAGPNAVLAFSREGYSRHDFNYIEFKEIILNSGFHKLAFKFWKEGLMELYRSYSKTAFTNALQKLIPEIKKSDLVKGGSGVRAQALDASGKLIDDFHIIKDENFISVLNAPSPAATSCLSIGEKIANLSTIHDF